LRGAATNTDRQHGHALFVTRDRKPVLLRIDPAVHDAMARWASDEFRSLNAHIELLLRRSLDDAGRMPKHAAPLPRRGRPRASESEPTQPDGPSRR
jgi:hypothetical protein